MNTKLVAEMDIEIERLTREWALAKIRLDRASEEYHVAGLAEQSLRLLKDRIKGLRGDYLPDVFV